MTKKKDAEELGALPGRPAWAVMSWDVVMQTWDVWPCATRAEADQRRDVINRSRAKLRRFYRAKTVKMEEADA